jgi:endonuclease/exonuclease/phosphatase family metal-dependent hydrolase
VIQSVSRFVALAFVFFTVVSSSTPAHAAAAKTLTFVSFNTRYYGLGGEMENSPSDEKRQVLFNEFFAKNVPLADVYAFQEVVDVGTVQGVLVPSTYSCLTYKNDFPKHQHVVLCVSPKYQILHEPSDNNDIIDAVAGGEGRSRPALHMILGDKRGTPLLRIVGVHLKAYPDQSATRVTQAREISKFLTTVADPHLPVVVTGDFNTFNHDEDAIDLILNQVGVAHVKNPSAYTFRTEIYASRFDHFYISSTLKLAAPMWTYPVCNLSTSASDMKAVKVFNDTISDHCPVSIQLKL